MTRRPIALLAALALSGPLAACAGVGQAVAGEPVPAQTTAAAVEDEDLARVLGDMLGTGDETATSCLVDVVREAGLSQAGLGAVVASWQDGTTDLGGVARAVGTVDQEGAAQLIDADTTASMAACAAQEGGASEYAATAHEASYPGGEPDLRPSFDMTGRTYLSSEDLSAGLAVIFASYTDDEVQARRYGAASSCMGEVISSAGMSEETMRFIASGPAAGAGTFSDLLPVADDRAKWESPSVRAGLADCVAGVREADIEDKAVEED